MAIIKCVFYFTKLEFEKIIKVTIIIILQPSWSKFEFHFLEIIW